MVWWIFQSLVTTAALAALVAVVCRFAPIGPVARHALWVLVLVKFVMPPVIVWPWAAPDPLGLARTMSSEIPQAVGAPSVRLNSELSPGDDVAETIPSARPQRPASTAHASDSLSPWTVFAFIWIAGSVCIGLVEFVRQVRLARRVRLAPPADPSITRRVHELASELGVKRLPVVTVTGMSPAVWCVGRPRLLWPADLTTGRQAGIDGIIVHELAHIKRRDHIVGWLELVTGLVWWWNPLLWSVQRARREQAELACDAWVISALPGGRRAYAESLLALSSPGAPTSSPMAAITGVRASSRRVLERRLVMIMNGRASLRLPSAGLLALALLAAATLPAWATGSPDLSQQQPPKVVEVTPKVQIQDVKEKPVAKSKAAKPVLKEERIAPPTIVKVQPRQTAKSGWKQEQWPRFAFATTPDALTAEGQKLVTDFSADLDAIQKEMEAKTAARREAVIQSLQALQDQYTKAGKLDEAVAIRDYLKAGGPNGESFWYSRVKR